MFTGIRCVLTCVKICILSVILPRLGYLKQEEPEPVPVFKVPTQAESMSYLELQDSFPELFSEKKRLMRRICRDTVRRVPSVSKLNGTLKIRPSATKVVDRSSLELEDFFKLAPVPALGKISKLDLLHSYNDNGIILLNK